MSKALLRIWADRVINGKLDEPLRKGSGAPISAPVEYSCLVMIYVDRFLHSLSFDARGPLLHVYGRDGEPGRFRWRMPYENPVYVRLRLGWNLFNAPDCDIVAVVVSRAESMFDDWIKQNPPPDWSVWEGYVGDDQAILPIVE